MVIRTLAGMVVALAITAAGLVLVQHATTMRACPKLPVAPTAPGW